MSNPLPQYRSHKIVGAFKIKSAEIPRHDSLIVSGHGFSVNVPDPSWRTDSSGKKRALQELIGGYFVKYAEGYSSWSPAKAFEEGYTLIEAKSDGFPYDNEPAFRGTAAPGAVLADPVPMPMTISEAIEVLKLLPMSNDHAVLKARERALRVLGGPE